MGKALGIGGLFIRAKDPKGLAAWYREHLGINLAPTDMEMAPWVTTEGVTVFAPFAEDTDYFRADKSVMINFRVDDIASLISHFSAIGVEVKNVQSMEGLGHFAHIEDPEGNPIELWQPEG